MSTENDKATEKLVTSTTGIVTSYASAEDCVEAILRAPPEFWKSGSGSVGIRYQLSPTDYNSLSVMCRPGHGFYVMYTQFKNKKQVRGSTFVALKDRLFNKSISLFVGGDFFLFSASAFVDPDTAKRVITHFWSTGERSPTTIWEQHPIGGGGDEIYGEPY